MVPLLALRVVEQAELLAIPSRARRLACATPVAGRLHAVVREVFEVSWAVLRAEQAGTRVALAALGVAAIVPLLFRIFAGVGRLARASAVPLPKAVLGGLLGLLLGTARCALAVSIGGTGTLTGAFVI